MNYSVVIQMKLPSLNDYIKMINKSPIIGNSYKQKYQEQISYFFGTLPRLEKPVRIHFLWVEDNKRRDYDNIAFAKKFILDALQKNGKLLNDNRKCVVGFSDDFEYGKPARVILKITEVDE